MTRISAGVFAALLLVAMLCPVRAFGHARLKSSTPEAGAHLNAVPRELRLDFSEVPELAFTLIQLLDPQGISVPLGALGYAQDSKRSVVVAIRGNLLAGDYTVIWQVAGDDGHPVRGRYQFVVAPGAAGTAGAAAPKGTATAQHGALMDSTEHHNPVTMPQGSGFGSESIPYVIIRWGLLIGLLLSIGAVAFRQLVLRFLRKKEEPDSAMLNDASQRAARIGHRAAAALLIFLLLRLVAQSLAMHGSSGILDVALIRTMLTGTVWGHGWLWQLAGIVMAGVGFHLAKTAEPLSPNASRGWATATSGIIVLAFTLGLAGHAASAPRLGFLTLLADGLHVLGAGGWLGSLTIVLFAGLPAALALPTEQRGPMVAELFNAFSPTALMFAGMVAATGVFAAWIHVGAISALWGTRYGRILLIKLAALSVVGLTGAYNWLRVKPTLGNIEAAIRIQLSARIEVLIGIVVLLITAILVATPTAMDMKM